MAQQVQLDISKPFADQPAVSSSALIPLVEKPQASIPLAQADDAWKHLRPLKRKAVVLEEEEYVETLEHIIARDYFPSLLPASDDRQQQQPQQDPLRPQQQSQQQEGQPPRRRQKTDGPTVRLNEWETADGPEEIEDSDEEVGFDGRPGEQDSMPPPPLPPRLRSLPEHRRRKPARDMSLTEFTGTHTSEDNQSFQELEEKRIRELQERYFWYQEAANSAQRLRNRTQGLHLLTQATAEPASQAIAWSGLVAASSASSEAVSSTAITETSSGAADHPVAAAVAAQLSKGPPTANLNTWNYRARNELMYYPTGDGIEQPSQVALRSAPAHLRPIIVPENTRFPEQEILVVPPSASLAAMDAISLSADGTPQIGGYRLLRTPSPSPHRGGATPALTWGGIVGTPRFLAGDQDDDLRLGPSDAVSGAVKQEPVLGSGSGNGVRYKLPQTPARDQLAWRLGDQARKSATKRAQMYTPSRPKTPGSATRTPKPDPARVMKTPARNPAVPFSPAAQRLLDQRRQAIDGGDPELRAAYKSPSIHRRY